VPAAEPAPLWHSSWQQLRAAGSLSLSLSLCRAMLGDAPGLPDTPSTIPHRTGCGSSRGLFFLLLWLHSSVGIKRGISLLADSSPGFEDELCLSVYCRQ